PAGRADGPLVEAVRLDGALQVLVTLALACDGKAVTWVPAGWDGMDVCGSLRDCAWAHIRLEGGGAEERRGSIGLFDAAGRPVARLSGLRLRPLRRLPASRPDELFLHRRWESMPAPAAGRVTAGAWLLIGGDDGFAAELAAALAPQGTVMRAAAADPQLARILAGRADWRAIIYLGGLEAPAADGFAGSLAVAGAAAATGCTGLLTCVQGLAGTARCPLWVVTRGAERIGTEPVPGVPQGALWGFARSLAYEYPELRGPRVDLDPAGLPDEAARLALLISGHDPGRESELAMRADGIWRARLARGLPAGDGGGTAGMAAAFRADATYLVTGGLGFLGRGTARWLAARGVRHLLLVGRSADQPEAAADLADLRTAGVSVTLAAADVADRAALAALIADITADRPLRGVVHAAGLLDDGLLTSLTPERFDAVLAPKIAGAWALHELTRTLPLDFFVLFSSVMGLLGSPGQTNYTAANSFLDSLARHRRALGLSALAIAWGTFGEGGLAAASERRADRLSTRGLAPLTLDEGLAVLDRLLLDRQFHGTPTAELAVARLDARQWLEAHPQAGGDGSYLANLAALPPRSAAPAQGPRRIDPAALPPADLRPATERLVRELAGAVLRLDIAEILPDTPWTALGIDSLMAMELRNRLEAAFGLKLSASLLWTYPNAGALAGHLADRLRPAAEPASVTVATPAQSAANSRERIAIIGIGCRFPGDVDSPEAYWSLLSGGIDAVTELPAERWIDTGHDIAAAGPAARWAGQIAGIDRFDAAFFGIAPREARSMDPQHRILLQVAWEALEHAGQPAAALAGRTCGMFLGIMGNDYRELVQAQSAGNLDAYATTGNGHSFAAGRIAYALGLQGPCVAVDTACSSSLVALHLACRSLRDGESDVALAGGVNLILSPGYMTMLSETQALSPDGRCKTFDARADGFVRGEGAGVVVLKRLSDALRDGDRVWALVAGSAVNQDGRSAGFTAPNRLAQEALIRRALDHAGMAPDRVGYVEAHGTARRWR
ncbi:SDR family NAD(P)-dependent oxidoreductase, partial [Azospirillum sp. B506]|uniref:SDR family NAD(P)-dependent oxidoreductase n=1 Tax=Azospirillum sp. B506 TaxID=137721 RepID=UPI0011DDBC7E